MKSRNAEIMQEERGYLVKVKTFIDQEVRGIEVRCQEMIEESTLSYAGSTEERKNAQYLRRLAHQERAQIKEIGIVKHSPYFARMDFDMMVDGQVEYQKVYIGKTTIGSSSNMLVYDWRTPIGERYYIKNEAQFNYNEFEYELLLRRAIHIQEGEVIDYEDEYNRDQMSDIEGVLDPFLIKILREKRGEGKLTDIIRTIQGNQNEIIRAPLKESTVVQGCAGSGKTMILLHRLSYLLYHHKELKTHHMKMITPNDLFSQHIDELTRVLEIEAIERFSIEHYFIDKLQQYKIPIKYQQVKVEQIQESELKYFYSDEFEEQLEQCYAHWEQQVLVCIKQSDLVVYSKELLGKTLPKQLTYQAIMQYRDVIQKLLRLQESWEQELQKLDQLQTNLQEELTEVAERISKVGQEIRDIEANYCQRVDSLEDKLAIYTSQLTQLEDGIQRVGDSLNKLEDAHRDVQKQLEQYERDTLDDFIQYKIKQVLNKLEQLEQKIKMKGYLGEQPTPNEVREVETIKKLLVEVNNPKTITYKSLCKNYEQYMATKKQYQVQNEQYQAKIMYLHGEKTKIKNVRDQVDLQKQEIQKEIDHDKDYLIRLQEMYQTDQITYCHKENLCQTYKEECVRLEEQLIDAEHREQLKTLLEKLPRDMQFIVSQLYEPLREQLFKERGFVGQHQWTRVDLYALLKLAYLHRGPLVEKEKYLYIDEGQDLDIKEYAMIQRINNQETVWNIYGDYKQLIHQARGTKEWRLLDGLFGHRYFELTQNYRNTVQITAYCNRVFEMEITPIGIDGQEVIQAACLEEAMETISLAYKRRALIVKQLQDEQVVNMMSQLAQDTYHEVKEPQITLVPDKLNILTVEMAKGLEFEAVIVYHEGMSRNEQYIAYTRALDQLIVLGDGQSDEK
ncbi:MAG: hypothetical protein ACRCTE_08955 [Cellulosilyticaceae bacterium]